MNKIRISAIVAASTLAAAMAATLPAATAASRSNPPPAGAVRLTGPLRIDPAIHYRTALVGRRALQAGTLMSSNWSGYAITARSGQTIGRIQAVFTVPNVNCARSTLGSAGTALFSDWAGLDGLTSNTVEQTGVGAECTSTTGPATYFGFFEMFPLAGVTFTGVNPGDAIVVVVQRVSAGWHLVFQDRTTGGGMSTVQRCPAGSVCRDANGEMITEDFNGAVAAGNNLADFAIDNQTSVVATSGGGRSGGLSSGSLWTSSTIDMVNGADRLATPGPLYGGEAFYLGWAASS
jgi:Peptidase A4 family